MDIFLTSLLYVHQAEDPSVVAAFDDAFSKCFEKLSICDVKPEPEGVRRVDSESIRREAEFLRRELDSEYLRRVFDHGGCADIPVDLSEFTLIP